MNANQRTLYRTAEDVRSRLAHDARSTPFLPEGRWDELQKLLRQIHRCNAHGFAAARKCLEIGLERQLSALVAALNAQLIQARSERPSIPSIREIYDDLAALSGEFHDVSIDFDTGTISVTTEPVTLGDVHLGPFEIRLAWRELGERASYRVIALEPNPAAANDAVTHPHVQDERLCEGDGREAIESALSQGRLGDFFLIISQLLQTYAHGQAYVELSRWQGTPCSDCGARLDDDDRYYCDRCDVDLCGGCSASCEQCERGFCSDCITKCEDCQRSFCESCLTACAGCESKCCQECLEGEMCSTCQAEEEEKTHEEEETHEMPATVDAIDAPSAGHSAQRNDAEIQPDSLGEAALSA